jgi:hypothetical protein
MKKNKAPCLLMTVCAIVCIVVLVMVCVAQIQFSRKYEGHLKRAADANSLKLAEKELSTALGYLIANGYNTESGRNLGRIDDHTSIVYSTPDEQISFHYDNVVASLKEVRAVRAKGDKATSLEKSNVLMKLRETLLDGNAVTYPKGLAIYPWNLEAGLLPIVALLVGVVGWLMWDSRS